MGKGEGREVAVKRHRVDVQEERITQEYYGRENHGEVSLWGKHTRSSLSAMGHKDRGEICGEGGGVCERNVDGGPAELQWHYNLIAMRKQKSGGKSPNSPVGRLGRRRAKPLAGTEVGGGKRKSKPILYITREEGRGHSREKVGGEELGPLSQER